MSTENNQSGVSPVSIFTVLLVIFLVWALFGGRHFFHNTGQDLKTTVQDAGHDLRSTGRDAASSIRDAVQ